MRTLSTVLTASALLFGKHLAAGEAPPARLPNVIFILMDDLGYGELGCYGQQRIETPHIDALAKSGILFTQHYSGAPVCAPARCTLLTGLHTGHAAIRSNDEMPNRGKVSDYQAMLENPQLEGQYPMPATTRTLGQMMKENGYQTAMIGKWGLGYPGSASTPNKMGFDFFYGYNCQRQAHSYYPMFLYRNENREMLNNAPLLGGYGVLDKDRDPRDVTAYEKFKRAQYAPDLMFNETKKFIDTHKDQPFFLMLTTPLPHLPLSATGKWLDYYVKKFGDETPYYGGNNYLPARYPHATYAAMISYFDEQIGEIVAQLKNDGIYDNTIIIFTSDNGASNSAGGEIKFFNSNSGLNGGKGNLYEGGIRVPLIVSYPAKIPAGRTSQHPSAFYDFMPTLADLTGAIANENTDGISFKNELLGTGEQAAHHALYWEYPDTTGNGAIAVRQGNWKLLWQNIKGGGKIRLFDLANDPFEKQDIATEHPQMLVNLIAIMQREHTAPENPRFAISLREIALPITSNDE